MSDPYIIKLVGGVEGIERYPELAAMIGQYVTRYEPQLARSGEQWLWVTPDPTEALGFADTSKLHEFYSQSIGTRPWDGRPDRPLTIFHIEVSWLSHFVGARA
jgi:hypothetical protein